MKLRTLVKFQEVLLFLLDARRVLEAAASYDEDPWKLVGQMADGKDPPKRQVLAFTGAKPRLVEPQENDASDDGTPAGGRGLLAAAVSLFRRIKGSNK